MTRNERSIRHCFLPLEATTNGWETIGSLVEHLAQRRGRSTGQGVYEAQSRRSVKKLFCGAGRDIIREENSLEILLAAGRMNREDEAVSLPSWVPDWRRGQSPLKGRPSPWLTDPEFIISSSPGL
ncbi:heterokaryon incompatibility protein [Colletotrichum scovillei]|uniref:Heterokaryon incompatibility protein n=1 Tax=Colletotrichum scovillei TaxID=1209932 RepID=A0A9P7R2L8_9PEZI|nr:heterokaryon incompatibility protein [Colletotrichum scovillei]KAG7059669.1 heterokaryon incompatibility protein [Colletotrichum scovillei]KAG7067119.1 heterokaryon incompatibility protein [Colletotrichum scovillei]